MSKLTLCSIACIALMTRSVQAEAQQAISVNGDVLHSAKASKLLPAELPFRGEEVFIEQRNSDGIRFPDGLYLVAAVIDTSGHASGTHEEFPTYLKTQVPLDINGHKLKPGIYDLGLNGQHRLAVRDGGAHLMFTVDAGYDSALVRPRPLQICLGQSLDSYRFYLGRNYVVLFRAD